MTVEQEKESNRRDRRSAEEFDIVSMVTLHRRGLPIPAFGRRWRGRRRREGSATKEAKGPPRTARRGDDVETSCEHVWGNHGRSAMQFRYAKKGLKWRFPSRERAAPRDRSS